MSYMDQQRDIEGLEGTIAALKQERKNARADMVNERSQTHYYMRQCDQLKKDLIDRDAKISKLRDTIRQIAAIATYDVISPGE